MNGTCMVSRTEVFCKLEDQLFGFVAHVCFVSLCFPFIVGLRVDLPFENDVNVIL